MGSNSTSERIPDTCHVGPEGVYISWHTYPTSIDFYQFYGSCQNDRKFCIIKSYKVSVSKLTAANFDETETYCMSGAVNSAKFSSPWSTKTPIF